MLDSKDRKFVGLTVAGTLALGGAAAFLLANYAIVRPLEHDISREIRMPGDTPVTLIGGSLIFKEKAASWQQSGSQYTLFLDTPVSSIVLKEKATDGSNDPDPAKDVLRFGVSTIDKTTWRVDEFINSAGPAVTNITTAPDYKSLVLQLNSGAPGALCFKPSAPDDVEYITNTDCDHRTKAKFDHISVTITENINGTAQTVATGSISCLDQNDQKGTCRIVFRE